MEILKNYNLTKLNTFGILAYAKFFIEIKNESELEELIQTIEFKDNKKFFLGGGSNILFTKDFDGIVVLNKLKGIEILEEDDNTVLIKSMAGETWHDLVLFAVSRNYWGIENLSLIPGTVGAAPMQNIGAYGVEFKNTLEKVEVLDITTGEKKIFTKQECELGYRDSVFKNKFKDMYFISAVTIRLNKESKPNLSYKVLSDYIQINKIEINNPKNISDAVSSIRRSKLPDPSTIGNAGSFFKNVFLEKVKAQEFLKLYPDSPFFEEEDGIKIPAGWLIEQCGWKGKRIGNVGVHDKQALVLVNHSGATGIEIKELSEAIVASVLSKFGLKLIPEVNFL